MGKFSLFFNRIVIFFLNFFIFLFAIAINFKTKLY